MKKTKQNQNAVNPALLNIVTPMGLDFKRTSLNIGEFTCKIFGVTKYPPTVETGWLSKVSNTPGTIISQTFIPADNTLLVESISKNIMQNRSIVQSTRDPLTEKRAERGIEDGERILTQIDQNGETVGYMTNLVMPIDNDTKRFEKLCRRVEGLYSSIRCKIRPLPNLQKEAFKMISPYHTPQQKIIDITQRIVPLSTFIGGFPFASSGYNDGEGTWFAMDAHGGMIVLDLWKRGGDRTNSNIVILGHSGQGKSTAIKNIILSEYMMGTKIIIADPESEYKDLCHNLNGDWINCGGGSGGRINPLQVKHAPKDDDDEADKLYVDEGNGMGDLALHMKTLDIFFNLYLPTLTDIQKVLLKDTLISLYKEFGITWDTEIKNRQNNDFPTFGDLYALINLRFEKTKNKEYETLSALLRDIAVGSDSFLWNGITTIKANSKVICLDTHDLQNTEDKIKRTQYFNILGWAWEQMSRDRTEKVMLIADEAYLMIDPNVPQSLVFLRNVAKRARKYESGIAIISHSLVDFLDPSVRMYGQPLLDMPSYKVIMGCDGRDLEDIISLYHLTDSEQELVYSKRRGHALCMIGSKRLHIWFMVPEYKMNLIGKGGGR
jgi:hypothetical protein